MGEWKHGLCGCFDNIGLCVVTYIAPCYIAGKIAEANGENCMTYGVLSLCGCVALWSLSKIRGQTREAKGIEGTYVNDLLMVWFCMLCAIVQEAQEWDLMPKEPAAAGISMSRE